MSAHALVSPAFSMHAASGSTPKKSADTNHRQHLQAATPTNEIISYMHDSKRGEDLLRV
jgi:hypothetical protein